MPTHTGEGTFFPQSTDSNARLSQRFCHRHTRNSVLAAMEAPFARLTHRTNRDVLGDTVAHIAVICWFACCCPLSFGLWKIHFYLCPFPPTIRLPAPVSEFWGPSPLPSRLQCFSFPAAYASQRKSLSSPCLLFPRGSRASERAQLPRPSRDKQPNPDERMVRRGVLTDLCAQRFLPETEGGPRRARVSAQCRQLFLSQQSNGVCLR